MKTDLKNCDRDPFNLSYSPKITDVYDKEGNIFPFLRQVYTPIIDAIASVCDKDIEDIELLDIGIGYGAFLKNCEENGFKNLYGMDPFPNSIEMAKKYISTDLRVGEIEKLPWPFSNNCFDVITCLDVVEHLHDPVTLFENIKSYIKDKGIIVIRTPNGEFPYKLRKLPFIGKEDINPTHINIHKPVYWKRLALKCDFKVIRSWKGEHMTHVRYIHNLGKILSLLKIDHRNVPIINSFEQAYIMILQFERSKEQEKN
jgi:2-polyprenyl-3-methyl-5-hydroxy-6-metoxy-1,4-benzoquinol methylase